MSLTARSFRGKRQFDDFEDTLYDDGRVPLAEVHNPHKRFCTGSSPSGRCGPEGQVSYNFTHTSFTALRSLFPEMSDDSILAVLQEYGDNMDAAIKHLTELRLSTDKTVIEDGDDTVLNVKSHETKEMTEEDSTKAAKSADDWVDALVQEMSAAKNVPDAKARAAKILQSFERAAVEHSLKTSQPRELEETLKENALLKRAVAIQNAKIQELSADGAANGEVARLRAAVEELQQRLHAAEVQNYSLQLHLKQAADSKDPMQAAFRNPDVY